MTHTHASEPSTKPRASSLALLGLSCRFPGAPNARAFWSVLAEGRCTIDELPRERAGGLERGATELRGGFLPDPAGFDAAHFNISPREASSMDPQQRWLLEVASEALDDAGLALDEAQRARTGVFVGLSTLDYKLLGARLGSDTNADLYATTGNAQSVAAGRISYALGLRGPAMVVDTACSSSLVALHLACRSLLSGECDAAVVAAANAIFLSDITEAFARSGMLAADGHCKTFDAAADGYVRSEGCGAVVLCRLSDAQQRGDRIRALIRGSSVNHDGRSNGLTAPSRIAQSEVISGALRAASVSPHEISYLEAHGTGTPLGDAIEAAAVQDVFARESRESPCVLGSVKTNLGHLEAAAGLAGLIKVVLALEARQIPAHVHFARPNPRIDFASVPLRIVTTLENWPATRGPRMAGVSSFGIGGTNAHVIVEESPLATPVDPIESHFTGALPLLLLSAASKGSLQTHAGQVAEFIAQRSASELATLCLESATRKQQRSQRLAIVAQTPDDYAAALDAYRGGLEHPALYCAGFARRAPRIGFVFPGQGGQWLGMGRELLACEPLFRAALERCDRALFPLAGFSVLKALTSGGPDEFLERASFVQPLTFALQVALCELLKGWGITPDVVIGHSMGEVSAACVAGALSLDDAAHVVCQRSQLVRRAEGRGRMAVIDLPAVEVEPWIARTPGAVAIAAENGPRTTLIAGDSSSVIAIVAELERRDVFCRLIDVQYASHSPHMAELAAPLRALLEPIAPREPSIAMISTLTGRPLAGLALDADYWVQNLCERVRFSGAIGEALASGCELLIEIGPHPVVKPSLQQITATTEQPCEVLTTLQRATSDRLAMSRLLAELHVRGARVDWQAVYAKALDARPSWLGGWPSYAWEHTRFWWPEATAGARPSERRAPISERVLRPCALRRGALECDLELSVEATPRLAHHQVDGVALWSAADQVEVMLEASASALGGPVVLHDLELKDALALPAHGSRRVQLVLEPVGAGAAPGARRISCFAIDPHAHDVQPTTVSCASVEPAPKEAASEATVLALLQTRCPRRVEAQELYASLASHGLQYGERYQTVREVWVGEAEALGHVQAHEADVLALGPLLDGCFHVASALLAGRVSGQPPMLPVSISGLRWDRTRSAAPVYSHVTLDSVSDERAELTVRVLDAEGREVGLVAGLQVRALREARQVPHAGDAWLHALRWLETPATQAPSSPSGPTVIVVGTREGVSRPLIEQLSSRSACARFLCTDDTAAWSVELDLLLASGAPIAAVVMAGAAESGDDLEASDLLASQRALCLSAQRVLQLLVRSKARHKPKLWWLTSGVHAIGESAPRRCPLEAAVWGLMRSLRYEHPDLALACVDLGARPSVRELEQLALELIAPDTEQEIALRDGARFVSRLRPGADTVTATPRREPARGRPFRLEIARPGEIDGLSLRPLVRRAPAAHEVEVEIEAAGVNFRDVLTALGALGSADLVVGREFAGRVSALGSAVRGLAVGQPVLGFADGTFGSFALADHRLVAPRPAQLHPVAAATLPIAQVSAYYALAHVARLSAGERVLVHAASGGVGLAALQWARHVGAELFATAGSEAKRDYLRQLGVKHVFDSRSLAFSHEILEATNGQGVDVVLNSLSGPFIGASLELLRDHGRFVELGRRDYEADERLGLRPFLRNLSLSLVDLRAMCLQRPERVGQLLREVLELVGRGVLSPLPAETFELANAPEAFFRMARAKHVGKLVLTPGLEPELEAAHDAPLFRKQASYLITGGLGGLGLQLARYIAECGAGQLVLAGRRPPSELAEQTLRELRERGVEVEVVAIDVSDAAQVRQLFARFGRDLRPLGGVFHAAGVLADGLFLKARTSSIEKVLAPKTLGAWNLYRACEPLALDCFVLFSSAAGLLGSPGQAVYAAANAFLDALAGARRSSGKCALSVDWGTFSEVGLAAASSLRGGRLEQRGLASISPEQAFAVLERLLRSTTPAQLGVLDLDARQLLEFYPSIAASPTFSELTARAPTQARSSDALALQNELRAQPLAAQRVRLQSVIWTQLCSVLRISGGDAQIDAPFKELGLDSLMALELRNRLERTVGAALSAAALWRYPTTRKLADGLIELLGLIESASAQPAQDDADELCFREGQAAELSDEQALALIEQLGE